MSSVRLTVRGILNDIQAAQNAIITAVQNAGCTFVPPINILMQAQVSSLSVVASQPLTASIGIDAPANNNFQTLITNLTTVKTSFPNLAFTMSYQELGSL